MDNLLLAISNPFRLCKSEYCQPVVLRRYPVFRSISNAHSGRIRTPVPGIRTLIPEMPRKAFDLKTESVFELKRNRRSIAPE